MGLLYVAAGINHFVHPGFYLRIMPPWLPAHELLVFLSGLAELILGLLLFIPKVTRVAAWGIILLLIAVFPANIQMMLDYRSENNPLLWLGILRLPLQLLLIWWAFRYTRRYKSGRIEVRHRTYAP